MSNRLTYIIAGILLTVMFLFCVFSMKDDSVTMDEVAHLPAGYSYLTQKDMRLNPEHPPLMKDLAAIPLLFIKNINFLKDIKSWQEDVNGQWDFGFNFLYQSSNPVDKMIFWGRIPMILILILLGFYIFKWTKELFGQKTAFLALFLFSFSPTFLAHGRLVTTDVGAATGVFIATYYFIKTLQKPTKKNIISAGIAFCLAELCKFSVILLVPFFAILALAWWLVKLGTWRKTLKIFILVMLIGFILIWPIYQYHVWNYPPERQVRDAGVALSDYPDLIKKPILFAADKPILRPYAQYLTGLLMVFHRAAFGNTTYFLGEVSNLGWKNYFPVVYSIKEPLTFHILTLIALLYTAWSMNIRSSSPFTTLGRLIKKPFWQNTFQRTGSWIKNHFPEFSMLCFIGLYWTVSLVSSLNIGVRHLLPVFPFTILLVSGMIGNLITPHHFSKGKIQSNQSHKKWWGVKLKLTILGILILWQAVSVISIYPHFLAYFNELAGGPSQGYIYTVDSNLDWGQDLKRLAQWADKNLPAGRQVYVDYFGGGNSQYYLKEKYAPWGGQRNPEEFPKGNYLAVSATFLQQGRGKVVAGLNQPEGEYQWLDNFTPVAKIGYSIFIYKID